MDLQNLIVTAQASLVAGHSLKQIAHEVVKNAPDIRALELITILVKVQPPNLGLRAAVSFSSESIDSTVASAIYYAEIVMASSLQQPTTPPELATALKTPGAFPQLTALQMGEVLKATGVFPNITAQQMQAALTAAAYSAADVAAAIAQLFPQPVGYRRLGPAGTSNQMPFDDTQLATTQPLVQLIVRHGNIVDGIQAFYGPDLTATPMHGGMGGNPTTLLLKDDPIIEVSGLIGLWFGGSYVLQLTIKTRSQVYPALGNMNFAADKKIPFTWTVAANEQVVGFFGSAAYGDNKKAVYLGTLGIIIKTG